MKAGGSLAIRMGFDVIAPYNEEAINEDDAPGEPAIEQDDNPNGILEMFWYGTPTANECATPQVRCAYSRSDAVFCYLERTGLTCDGAPYDFGVYSFRAQACGGLVCNFPFPPNCSRRVDRNNVHYLVTRERLGCPPPPPPINCKAPEGSCGECMPGGSGGGGGGPGAGGPGGGPGDGPGTGGGAYLWYQAGGAGHPTYPGSPDWNVTLGRYWSHDYAERIVPDPDESHVWLITRYATFREFTDTDADGLYDVVEPTDEERRLEHLGPSLGWELTDLEGTVTLFADDGTWLSTTDRNQNQILAEYDAMDRLSAVHFPDGRREDFAYDEDGDTTRGPDGKLHTITEVGPEGATRVWTYLWDGDDLEEIHRPDGTSIVYTYDVTHAGFLTLITLIGDDGTSERIERGYAYDADGNVEHTWRGAPSHDHADAVDHWEFQYNGFPSTETTVIEHLAGGGEVHTVYTLGYDGSSIRPKLLSTSGGFPSCGQTRDAAFEYDDPDNPLKPTRITEGIDASGVGVVTELVYDPGFGQVTLRRDAVGTPEARQTCYSWNGPDLPGLLLEVEGPIAISPLDPPPADCSAATRRRTLSRDGLGNVTVDTVEGFEGGSLFNHPTVMTYSEPPAAQPWGLLLMIDPPGHGTADVTTFAYDDPLRPLALTSRTEPLSDTLTGTTTYQYDDFLRPTFVTDPNGLVTETRYDELDRVELVVQHGADPAVVEPSVDLVTDHQYLPLGDLGATTLPAGNEIRYAYDHAGRLERVERWAADQSAAERTRYELLPDGNRFREHLEVWNGAAFDTVTTTEYAYWSRSHLAEIRHPDGTATRYDYDCRGNLDRVWDANHPFTGDEATTPPTQRYAYDALDRLVTLRQPWPEYAAGWDDADPANEAATTYGYDVQDHLVSVLDAEGNQTTYIYSDRDLLTEEASPVSGTTTHAYDEHGELVSTTDGRGVTMTRLVDAADRVTFVDYPGTELDVTYHYGTDPALFEKGRLTGIERDGQTILYAYDLFGRLTQDGELTYGYDLNGNRTDVEYPGAVSAEYVYDFADRQKSLTVTTPAGTVPVASGATYLPSGPLVSLDLGNGTSETRAFDDRYFPESIAWSGPPARTWAHDTDAVGNVTSIERTVACTGDVTVSDETFSTDETVESCAGLTVGPNVTLTATADVAFRAAGSVAFLNGFSVQTGARMSVEPGAVVDPPELRLFDYQDGPYFLTLGDGPWGERDWTYDRIGNRLTETRNRSGTPETDTYGYTLNGAGGNTPLLDQVLLSPSGTADYAWDPAGNLDALTRGANVLDFTFDGASRMSAIDRASDSALFLYDGRSFLRSAEEPSTTASVEPLYASAGLLHGLLEKDTPTGPERRHTLFYLAGRPVAQLTQDAASETWRYLTTDHLGTPLLASDVAGSVTWSGGFEPFGDDFAEGTAGAALANDLFLRFPGQWETELWADASLGTGGLYYNVHRWYAPTTGRYTRPDPTPVPLYVNRYAYVESDPINWTDSLGLNRGTGRPYHPSIPTRCRPQDSCETLGRKISELSHAISAHRRWDEVRGVRRHEIEIKDFILAIERCKRIYNEKGCGQCEPCDTVKQYVPVVVAGYVIYKIVEALFCPYLIPVTP